MGSSRVDGTPSRTDGTPTRTDGTPSWLAVGLLSAGCCLLAVLGCLVSGGPVGPVGPLVLLCLLVLAAENVPLRLVVGQRRWVFSLTEALLAAALLVHPGPGVVPAVAGGVLLAQLLQRRDARRTVFNTAQSAAAAAAAAGIATAAGGGVVAVVLGVGAFWLVGTAAVAVVLALASGGGLVRLVGEGVALSAPHAVANASTGVLAGHLLRTEPVALLGLVVPLALVGLACRSQVRSADEQRLVACLDAEAPAERSPSLATAAVVAAAARSFDAETRFRPPDADEAGGRVLLQAAHGRSRREALVALRPTGGGPTGGGPTGGRRPGGEDPAQAVLHLVRPAAAPPFSRRELRLLDVFAREAGQRLGEALRADRERRAFLRADRVAESARALGDLGAEAGPALARLRELADRFSAVAAGQTATPGLHRLASELRAAERVVASLAGAVALHAEPGLTDVVHEVTADEVDDAADAWTTTGTADTFALSTPVAGPPPAAAQAAARRRAGDAVVLPEEVR